MHADRVCECGHGEDDHGGQGFRACLASGCDCDTYLQDDDHSVPRGMVASPDGGLEILGNE